MTINPKDAKPDQPYKVTLDGEWYVAVRNNPRQEHSEWRLIPKPGVQALWAGDGAVKNLTPLVPARSVTRDDLPSVDDVLENPFSVALYGGFIGKTLDAVVAHLNGRGGIPAGRGKSCCEEAQLTAAELARRNEELSEADVKMAAQRRLWDSEFKYWSGRAEKAERERDEARESASRANEFAATCQRERDEWESNADALEAKLDAAVETRHNLKFNESGGVPTGRGKSCCEEAQLTANELARWKKELSEAEGEIAELTKRAEKAESERDDWKAGAEAESWAHDKTLEEARRFHVERDEARGSRDYWIDLYGELRDELQAKLDAAENRSPLERDAVWQVIVQHCGALGGYYMGLLEDDLMALVPAAENRPTLDREAVRHALNNNFLGHPSNFESALSDIMALAPAAEGWPDGQSGSSDTEPISDWPEWLGPKVDPNDFEMRRTEKGRVVGEDGRIFAFEGVTAEGVRNQVHSAVEYAAQLKAAERFIESEQAERDDEISLADSATGDEDQRVEEQAKALYCTLSPGRPMAWRQLAEDERENCRAAIRAGWTPPESEAK